MQWRLLLAVLLVMRCAWYPQEGGRAARWREREIRTRGSACKTRATGAV